MSNATPPSLPQPPLPFPSDAQGTYHGLTLEQIHADYKQMWANLTAWPKTPQGGWQGNAPDGKPIAWHADLTGYQLSGLNVARNQHGETTSQKDLLVSLGLDPNADHNHRH